MEDRGGDGSGDPGGEGSRAVTFTPFYTGMPTERSIGKGRGQQTAKRITIMGNPDHAVER